MLFCEYMGRMELKPTTGEYYEEGNVYFDGVADPNILFEQNVGKLGS
jgi:hypothetical protein